MRNNLILKTLFRLLKENDLYNEFINSIPLSVLNNVVNKHIMNGGLFLSMLGVRIKPPFYNLREFLLLEDINKHFNRIIFLMCKPMIIKYIEVNHLTNKINNAILFSFLYKNYPYTNINNYLNYIFNNGLPPSSLFSYIFEWSLTREGYDFWANINNDFKKYLFTFLISGDVNENYSQTSFY